MKISPSLLRKLAGLLTLYLAVACDMAPIPVTQQQPVRSQVVKVNGEVYSADSHYFGAPSVHNIWQYTIAFMAPDGSSTERGSEILRFDTNELNSKIREKNNALNEKLKESQKQEIIAQQQLAELRLLVEQSRSDVDKAVLKAKIPESLLANRDYQENQLLLKQARLIHALRDAEVQKEVQILAIESKILEQEITVLKREIQELMNSVETMSIKAPANGVVIHSLDRHGNKFTVGDNVWSGMRVLEFPDLSKLELRLEIPERDSAWVNIGQTVVFGLDAVPDRVFHGEITELAAVIHSKSNNQPAKVFDAKVALLDPDPEIMRPGIGVNAEILIAPVMVSTP